MTVPLSPSAQAVLDAFHKELSPDNQPGGLPAALRAAADQRKLGPDEWESSHPDVYERGWHAALRSIPAIANELDPTP